MFIYRYMAGLVETDEGEEEDVNFDPHEHRKVKKPTTDMETLVHLLKGSIGTGLLAMPDAVEKAGLIIGFFGTVIIGTFATYCIHLLIKAQYKLCRIKRVGHIHYPESMKFALLRGPNCLRSLAETVRLLTIFFLVFWQIGICCVYIVFVSANFKQVADFYGFNFDLRLHMLMISLPLFLMNLIENLKILAPVSTGANLLTFIGLLFIFFYLIEKDVDFQTVFLFGKARNLPLYVGTTLFALEAVGVILALEHNMANPHQFLGICGIFNRGMFVIVLLYALIGALGYATYGVNTEASVTLNLPQADKKAQAAKLMYAVAVLFSYPLQSFVAVELIWVKTRHKIPQKMRQFALTTIQLGIVVVTLLLAVSVPRLGLFISLFGALCLSVLAIILPGLLDLCVYYPDQYGFANYRLIRDIIIIIIGISAFFLAGPLSLEVDVGTSSKNEGGSHLWSAISVPASR